MIRFATTSAETSATACLIHSPDMGGKSAQGSSVAGDSCTNFGDMAARAGEYFVILVQVILDFIFYSNSS
ncbi:hypothetical protein M758_2G095300 [Ceratodon purpureus]|nr:hypothetical protein M758_2G095300 [Ceratodon purpureus]